MRRRRKLRIVASLLLLLFVTALLALAVRNRPTPLVYQGKNLDEWLRPVQMFSPIRFQQTQQERDAHLAAAEAAIRHFGTNAIPYALDHLRARDPWWRGFLIKHKFYKAATIGGWEQAVFHHGRGVFCLYVLGADAEAAVPKLQQMLENPDTVAPAALSLFVMSSNTAKLPLPYITNANPLLRRPVITAMCDAQQEQADKLSEADAAWAHKAGFTNKLPNGTRTY